MPLFDEWEVVREVLGLVDSPSEQFSEYVRLFTTNTSVFDRLVAAIHVC